MAQLYITSWDNLFLLFVIIDDGTFKRLNAKKKKKRKKEKKKEEKKEEEEGKLVTGFFLWRLMFGKGTYQIIILFFSFYG